MSDKFVKTIDDIANKFISKKNDFCGPGLHTGQSGIALFLFYYSRLRKTKKSFDVASSLIIDVFDAINSGFNIPTFCDGITGYAWTVEHLVQNGFIHRNTVPFLDDLDVVIYKQMIKQINDGNWDFLHGALGGGVYFFDRLHKQKSKEYLGELLAILENQNIKDNDGQVYWANIIGTTKEVAQCNLGMAHGMASIIAFLSKLITVKETSFKANELLKGSIQFLMRQKLSFEKHERHFPEFIYEEGITNQPEGRRIGWCYGDMCRAIVLYQASVATNDIELRNFSVQMLLDTVKFKDLEIEDIHTPFLCHGSAGIAHIYSIMYQYTKLEEFKVSANYWFDKTLTMPSFIEGMRNFDMWLDEEDNQEGYGVLDVAGIGLALISEFSNTYSWNRCLLLS